MRIPPPLQILSAAFAVVTDMMGTFDPGPARDPAAATPVPALTPRAVENYAYAGCSDKDIADRFLVDEEFIRTQFRDVLRASRGYRAYRIHKAQTDSALSLCATILIWLGRNLFAQSNNPVKPGLPEPIEEPHRSIDNALDHDPN